MKIWVVTNGAYEDEKVVGMATSASEAEEMVHQMHAHDSNGITRYDADFAVYGPFDAGQPYDRYGNKI